MITSVDSISPYPFYRSLSDLRTPTEFGVNFFEVGNPEKQSIVNRLSVENLSIGSIRIKDPVYVERDTKNRGSVLYILRRGILFRSIEPVWFDSDPPHKESRYRVGDIVYVSFKNGVLKQRIGPYHGFGKYFMVNPRLSSIFSFATLDDVICLDSEAESEIF